MVFFKIYFFDIRKAALVRHDCAQWKTFIRTRQKVTATRDTAAVTLHHERNRLRIIVQRRIDQQNLD